MDESRAPCCVTMTSVGAAAVCHSLVHHTQGWEVGGPRPQDASAQAVPKSSSLFGSVFQTGRCRHQQGSQWLQGFKDPGETGHSEQMDMEDSRGRLSSVLCPGCLVSGTSERTVEKLEEPDPWPQNSGSREELPGTAAAVGCVVYSKGACWGVKGGAPGQMGAVTCYCQSPILAWNPSCFPHWSPQLFLEPLQALTRIPITIPCALSVLLLRPS